MPVIAIIIVNWNGKKDTLHCLSSLKKLSTREYMKEIVVVDNGSSDGSVKEIRRHFPEIHIIETEKNLGFTGGNNIGMTWALEHGVDFVWLLNNDTLVDSQAMTELVKFFDDQRVGIAGSKIYFAPGHEYHKERYKPSERGNVLWYAGGRIDWNNMYASHRGVDEVDHGQFDLAEETPFVTGCSMMIKTSVLRAIGTFDDLYYLYLEDLDFCLRAQRAGYKTMFIPSSKIWHVNAGSSGGPGSRLHEYYQTRNRLLLGLRYAPIRTKIALLRQAFWFLARGNILQKKAVRDFFLRRLGNQSYEANN